MNATVSGEIAVLRAGTWVPPSQCPTFKQWIHQAWVDRSYWERHDCLVFVVRRRWLGFEFEFAERRLLPDELM